MRGLGEQIAVLDGLGALDPNDGRIGQRRVRVDQYGRRIAPGVMARRVINASNGGNYSGGSNYPEIPIPLMTSSIGLADMPGVLPMKRTVAPSNGYSGGASWTGGMPLLPSNAGLANALIDGGYGRAGLGASLIDGGYGRAGLGSTGTAADEDLAAAAEAVAVARQLDPADGRTGQMRPRIDEYGRRIAPGVLERSNVIDPSEGGNYGGGSSWEPGIPLTPSNAGLAGCGPACGGLGQASGAARALQIARARNLYSQQKAAAKIQFGIMQKTAKIPAARGTYQQAASRYRMHVIAMCRLRVPAGLGMTPQCQALLSQKRVTTPVGTEMWR